MQLAADYDNPAVAPFDSEPLVRALNACLVQGGGMPFIIGNVECALEFLLAGQLMGGRGLLDHLETAPNYLVSYLQEGTCPRCNGQFHQVSYSSVLLPPLPQAHPEPSLHLPVRPVAPGQAVDLRPLLQAAQALQLRDLVCPARCTPNLLPTVLQQQQGNVMLLDLVRVGHYGTVCSLLPSPLHLLNFPCRCE